MGGLRCEIFNEAIPSKAKTFAFDPLSYGGCIANNIDYLVCLVNPIGSGYSAGRPFLGAYPCLSFAARTNAKNNGCGCMGRDFNSGWA